MRATRQRTRYHRTPTTTFGDSRRSCGSDPAEGDPEPQLPAANSPNSRSTTGRACVANETGASRWSSTGLPALAFAGWIACSPLAALHAAEPGVESWSEAPANVAPKQEDPARARLEKAFRKLGAKRQLEVLAKMAIALADGDTRTAARLRAAWTTEGQPAAPTRSGLRHGKTKSRRSRTKPRVHRWEGQVPFALTLEYRFPTKNIEQATLTTGSKRKVLRGRKLESELRLRQFRGLLDGYAKDTDALVANVIQTLDTDPGEDRFAAFLDGWQDKGRPFYVALDETAGTQKSVFFFDAMLAGFLRKVPSKAERAPLAKSLDAAHDALHSAFLNYRQYRALREAIALTLVLPPDAPLPEHLRLYDSVDGYSTRDFLRILLVTVNNDPARLLSGLQRNAPALPQPLWSSRYEPLEPIAAWFKSRLDRLDEHSDQVLEKAKQQASTAWQAARQRALTAARDALL